MTQGYVVSDLHIFGVTSSWPEHEAELHSAANTVTSLVLNGDTFDILRSTLSSTAATVKAAVGWIEDFLSRHPSITVHYIVGNHDCVPALLVALREVGSMLPALILHDDCLKLGSNVFLHGDVANGFDSLEALTSYRMRYGAVEPSYKHISIARGLQRLRMHRFAKVLNPTERTCRRVLTYLRNTRAELLERGVSIYFGHTHVPIEGFELEGFRFYNTGSGIEGLWFRPRRFEY